VTGFGALPSSWRSPELSGMGRLPMRDPSLPFPSVESARAGGPSPNVLSLDGTWRFRLLDRPEDAPGDFAGPDFDDSSWGSIAVPGDWAFTDGAAGPGAVPPAYLNIVMPFDCDPPDVPDANPTGLYRRSFRLPAGWSRRRVELRVGGAESVVHVFVNGAEVGFGKDSRLPSTFEVSRHLRAGRNTVALAVVQWSDASWLEDQDQWWLGGIHRGVSLIATGHTTLTDVTLLPGLDTATGIGTLDAAVTVGFDERPAPGWTVAIQVETARGRSVATLAPTEVPVFEHGDPLTEVVSGMYFAGQAVRARLEVPDCRPWSHESPTRYRAVVTLLDPAGEVAECRSVTVGFRSVEVRDNQLLINDQPVLIVGVNHHEFDPDRGRVPQLELMRRDLELMKTHHINAVRCSHAPHDERFYDLCDELGLYVIDEANVETHARQASLCHDPRYFGAIVERGVRMVQRDKNHPCIVAWSLGNESGYGAAHDALAAAIRRLDPTRPLHYEGVLMHDLFHPATVTDIVCPMYTPIDEIVAWARSGRDARRPLILCEYSHAMGNSNGSLADYFAAFEAEHGLQGGFIWEWVDHGIRRRDCDGREWFGYGGDFGEDERFGRHDGNFCCDGLVSPDRVPHPAMAELAALAQPVRVTDAGRGRLRVENRRWFTDLSDVRARWELADHGKVIARGRLDLPSIAPRRAATVAAPRAPGATHLTVRFASGRRPVGWSQMQVGEEIDEWSTPWTTTRTTRRAVPAELNEHGLIAGDVAIGWPELSVMRAPTDNAGIQVGWMTGVGVRGRWVRRGLDQLSAERGTPRRRHGVIERRVDWHPGVEGEPIVHRQRVSIEDNGGVRFDEHVEVPKVYKDLARVGVTFALPAGFEDVAWYGLGPHETYADRCRAEVGQWRSTVLDQYVDYVFPQHHGTHHDTRWFELSGHDQTALRVVADRPIAFSALHHSVEDLTAARHTVDLVARPETFVHLDVAHRGLGTASCGPDTLPRFRVGPGRYRWSWAIRGGAR